MSTDATLTSKGQTTIPEGNTGGPWHQTGDHITFTPMPDGTVSLRVKTKSLMTLAGMLHKKGRKRIPTEKLPP